MSRSEEDDNAADGSAELSAKRKRATRLLRGVAVVALVLFLLPHGIRWGMTTWLEEHGAVESRIENIDFNPFTGHLTIAGLSVRGAEEERLVCRRFEINFDWLPLANKHLDVVSLKVQELDVDVRRRDDGQWILGGIALPPQEKKEEKGEWHWGLGSVRLSRLAVDLHTEEIDERFIVDQLHLANIYSWEDADATPFRLQLHAFGGDLVLEGHGRPFSKPISIDADLRIKGMALNALEPVVERPIGGELDVDLGVQAEKEANDGPLQFRTSGEIGVADFLIAVGDLRLSGASLDWTGTFRFSADEEHPWALEGDLNAETVALDDPEKGLGMARVKGLKAEGAQVTPDDVTIDSALLSRLEAFERPQIEEQAPALEKVTHLLEADNLELGTMRFNDDVMRFERGILTGAQIHMVRRPGMGMELSGWLEEDQQEAKSKDGTKSGNGDSENGAGRSLQIEDFRLNEARLVFVDQTVSPPVRLDVRPLQLHVKNLDQAAPDKQTSVVLDAEIDQYGALRLEGTLRPFGESLHMALTGEIDAFHLPSLSPYAARHLDYRIMQGHLDASLNWRVDNWQLDAANDLKIAKLQVESLKDDRKSRLTQILGLRASTALSLLRDDEENIEIEVPVRGDLRNPKFEFDKVIISAVRKTVQQAAVSYYAPLGLSLLTGVPLPPGSLTLANRVINWMTSVKFDPVPFDPGSSDLNETARNHLEKVKSVLQDKDDLRVVLCGRAGAVDMPGDSPPDRPWEEATRQALLELARKRMLAVKEALVASGIKADRLFLCQPQLGEKEKVEPVVDIYL